MHRLPAFGRSSPAAEPRRTDARSTVMTPNSGGSCVALMTERPPVNAFTFSDCVPVGKAQAADRQMAACRQDAVGQTLARRSRLPVRLATAGPTP
jgi:hypothetical protein